MYFVANPSICLTHLYHLSEAIVKQCCLEHPMCAHVIKRVFHLFCKWIFITMFSAPFYIELCQSYLRTSNKLLLKFQSQVPCLLLLLNLCLLFHPRQITCVTFRIMFMPLYLLFSASTAIILSWLDCHSGPGPPCFWGFETTGTPHLVGLLWTSDRPDAETSTWQHKTFTRERHSCPGGIWTRNVSQQASGHIPRP
jgi:hypothetical protein